MDLNIKIKTKIVGKKLFGVFKIEIRLGISFQYITNARKHRNLNRLNYKMKGSEWARFAHQDMRL